MRLVNINKQIVLSNQVIKADNFIARLKGLMGKKSIAPDSVLVLKPCNQVHTFFMRFNIDVVFLDADWRVNHVIENMPPWRISKLVPGAKMVLEFPGGVIKNNINPGDILKTEE